MKQRVPKNFMLLLIMLTLFTIFSATAFAANGNVAKIGDTEYATLQAAIDACPTDGTATTITMIADYTGDGITNPSEQTGTGTVVTGQNITLDLAGHTIQTELTTDGSHYHLAHVLYVNGGTLTLKDSSANQTGAIINTNSNSYFCTRTVLVTNHGSFTMESGRITAKSGEGMRIDNATVNLKAGTVEATTGSEGNAYGWDNAVAGIEVRGNSTVTIDGATIISRGENAIYSDQASDKITIKSGVLSGNKGYGAIGGDQAQKTITITGGYFSSDPTDFLDVTAYKAVVQEGEHAGYYKVEEIIPTAVTVKSLEELKAAAASATVQAPKAITIEADIVIDSDDITLGSTSKLTIANGYKLSVVSKGIFRNDGKTTNNGTINVSNGGYFSHIQDVQGNGTVTGYPGTNGIYKISCPMDLQWLAYLNRNEEDCKVTNVALAKDIAMPENVNFDPIPYFKGTFNGAGHSISNLQLNSTSANLGLFNNLGVSGDHTYVKNLTIDETLKTVNARCGGLAATTKGNVHITGVTMKGTMTASGATYYFAPFVGYANNNGGHLYVADSTNNMTVTANKGANIGPIIGSTGNGQSFLIGIYNFTNIGTISATGAANSIGYVAGYSYGSSSSALITIDVINYRNSGSITNNYGTWSDIGTGTNYLCCNSGNVIFTTDYIATTNTAYYNSGEDKYEVKNGDVPATSISLNKSTLKIYKAGDLAELQATLNPANSTDTVTWTSSNEAVATVNQDGLITSVTSGATDITAKVNDNIKVTCTLTVCPPVTITAKNQTIAYGGKISQTLSDVEVKDLDTGVKLNTITLTPSTEASTENGEITPSGAVLLDGEDNDVSSLYDINYLAGKLIITPAESTAATVQPNNFTYDKTEHPLLTVDESKLAGGKMWYALGDNATKAPNFDGTTESGNKKWKTSIPTATDAGTYYVWYKVVGDGNHSDTDPKCITVTIAPGDSMNNEEGKAEFDKNDASSGIGGVDTNVVGNQMDDIAKSDDTKVGNNQAKDVTVTLEAKAVSEKDVPKEDKSAIDNAAKNVIPASDVGTMHSDLLDISIEKIVVIYDLDGKGGKHENNTIKTKLTNLGQVVDIPVKYDLTNKHNPTVVRYHNGAAQVFTKLNAEPSASDRKDATFFIEGSGKNTTIHIYTDKFSTYALLTYGNNDYVGQASAVTPPAAKNLTYTGNPQELVTAGEAKDGSIVYALGKDASTVPDASAFTTSIPTAVNAGTYYVWYMVKGDALHTDTQPVCIQVTIAKKAAPAVDTYKTSLQINAGLKVSQPGSKVKIKWGKVTGANMYEIWGGYCGKKAKLLKTVKGNTNRSVTIKKINGKKLKLKSNYKFYVAAYRNENGTKTRLGKTFMAHVVGRKNTKETNVKGIKLKKKSYSLKKGKTARIKGKLVLVHKNKKPLGKKHGPKFRYASTNKAVATVTKNGKITAKGKGSCIVYVYAINGYAKKVKVTVR